MSILAELKRRHVFRVALLYLAVGWLILQATDVLGSLLGLPNWIGKLVVLLLALGFPAALAFSWLYELTPDGLQRDSLVSANESRRNETTRRLNLMTIAAVSLAVVAIVVDRLLPEATAPTGQITPPVTVAVLPFVNLGSDADGEHFADGITEEILNLLANVQGLRVTSRTSSFSFKGQSADLPTIARKLGVRNVVEGSVRRAGTSMRVTAQLIDVESDTHVWSGTFDRKITNVFAIQADVASQIARVLTTALSADELALIGMRPTNSLGAWQNFVAARHLFRNRIETVELDRALSLVDLAIREDPQFARAHSLRAALLLGLVGFGGPIDLSDRSAGNLEEAVHSARRALELEPRLGEPYYVLAIDALWRGQFIECDDYFRQAILRAPNNADGRNWYGTFLLEAGYLQRAWAEKEYAAELDPLSPIIAWQVAFSAVVVNRLDVVRDYTVKAMENGWPEFEPTATLGGAAWQGGDFHTAETLYKKARPDRAEQIGIAFAAIRKQRIDAETRNLLDGLIPYGPPGLARFHVEVQAGDLDAAFATAWSVINRQSLTGPGGTGGPSNAIGELIRPDWWLPGNGAFRRDPRFVELLRATGLIDLWRAKGWPDLCEPVGDAVRCR